MMHYTELSESKGIVLMVGEYDKDVLVSKLSLYPLNVFYKTLFSGSRELQQHYAAVKLGNANLLPTLRDPNYSFHFETK